MNWKGMKCVISKELILNFLEWVLFIVLCIISIGFSYGVLDNFFSMRTSFSQNEEPVYDYPIIGIVFKRKFSKVNLADVEIHIAHGLKGGDLNGLKKLEIGENHFHNEEHNKTETILLENFKTFQDRSKLCFTIVTIHHIGHCIQMF